MKVDSVHQNAAFAVYKENFKSLGHTPKLQERMDIIKDFSNVKVSERTHRRYITRNGDFKCNKLLNRKKAK